MFRTTMKTAALLIAAAALAASFTYASAAAPAAGQRSFDPPPFDGRVGQVSFQNTSAYAVKVTLWHPDSRAPWGRQTVAPGETYTFTDGQGDAARVGNNWGIQIGNSQVRALEDVADWDGAFEVSVDSFWQQ